MRRAILSLGAFAGALAPIAAGAVDPGDVVISELMIRSESAPEWVELHNPTALDVLLDGCVLEESATPRGSTACSCRRAGT